MFWSKFPKFHPPVAINNLLSTRQRKLWIVKSQLTKHWSYCRWVLSFSICFPFFFWQISPMCLMLIDNMWVFNNTNLVKNFFFLFILLFNQFWLLSIKVFSFGPVCSLTLSTRAGCDHLFYLIYNGSDLAFIQKWPWDLKKMWKNYKIQSQISCETQHK